MYKAVRWLLLQDCASDGLLMQTIASGRLSMQTIASETRGPSTGSHALVKREDGMHPQYFLVLTLYTLHILDVRQEATVALSISMRTGGVRRRCRILAVHARSAHAVFHCLNQTPSPMPL